MARDVVDSAIERSECDFVTDVAGAGFEQPAADRARRHSDRRSADPVEAKSHSWRGRLQTNGQQSRNRRHARAPRVKRAMGFGARGRYESGAGVRPGRGWQVGTAPPQPPRHAPSAMANRLVRQAPATTLARQTLRNKVIRLRERQQRWVGGQVFADSCHLSELR